MKIRQEGANKLDFMTDFINKEKLKKYQRENIYERLFDNRPPHIYNKQSSKARIMYWFVQALLEKDIQAMTNL